MVEIMMPFVVFVSFVVRLFAFFAAFRGITFSIKFRRNLLVQSIKEFVYEL